MFVPWKSFFEAIIITDSNVSVKRLYVGAEVFFIQMYFK